jgi:UDP:flavonoid glycosyltransferase YjiC (YdhE family)
VLPQGLPDQAVNAANVAAAGAGLVLSSDEVTADTVADRAADLLATPGFAARAGHIQQEIYRMPGPSEIVPVLRGLAAGP